MHQDQKPGLWLLLVLGARFDFEEEDEEHQNEESSDG